MRFVKPFDKELISKMVGSHKLLVTMEENVLTGGFGENFLEFVNETHIDSKVLNIAVPDRFIEHGKVDILKKDAGIDKNTVLDRILDEYRRL